jgi:CheY-like chemotaxis protein
MMLNLSGFEARECPDGPTALVAAREFQPQACIVDIQMPGMDGCEVARRLRDEFGPSLLLIALSALVGDDHEERVRAAGFDLSFSKPPNVHRLLEAVSSARERATLPRKSAS